MPEVQDPTMKMYEDCEPVLRSMLKAERSENATLKANLARAEEVLLGIRNAGVWVGLIDLYFTGKR